MADQAKLVVDDGAKAVTHDNAPSQRHRTPPSSSSSSSSSSVVRPSIVNSIASTPDHPSTAAVPASPRKRRQTDSPEREHRDDSSSSIGSIFSHDKHQRSSQHQQQDQSPSTALTPSPIVDPDIAQFPLSLFQSDTSDDASGQSPSTVSNNGNTVGGSSGRSSNGAAASAPSAPASATVSTQQLQASPDAPKPRDIRPMPLIKRPGKQRAVSPQAFKQPVSSWSEFIDWDAPSSVGSNDADDERSIDDFLRMLPQEFVEDVCRQLLWDAVHKTADGLPASVLAREERFIRKYSFFTQLRGYQQCRLVDPIWSEVFESEPLILSAFNVVMGIRLKELRGHFPIDIVQNALRSVCFACMLNDSAGDVEGIKHGFITLCTSRFGVINLCFRHAQPWTQAAKSQKHGIYVICDLCLMEGYRDDGRRSHLSGNILTNEDLSVGDSTWNTCESCRIDNFYEQWSYYPVTVPRKYRDGLQSTKAFTLFTAHGRGGAANAVADAHEELEQLVERQKERCDCSICKRMKRQRKDEVKSLEGAAKRREEAAAATAAAAIAAAAIQGRFEQQRGGLRGG